MVSKKNKFLLPVIVGCFLACSETTIPGENDADQITSDPLSSWNQGKAKTEIIQFVKVVTDSNTSDYIPVIDRIAVFDNDGTLWAEQPLYFQMLFAIDRLKSIQNEIVVEDDSPLRSLLDGNMQAFFDTGLKGVMQLVMTTHAGMSTDEFESLVIQ